LQVISIYFMWLDPAISHFQIEYEGQVLNKCYEFLRWPSLVRVCCRIGVLLLIKKTIPFTFRILILICTILHYTSLYIFYYIGKDKVCSVKKWNWWSNIPLGSVTDLNLSKLSFCMEFQLSLNLFLYWRIKMKN
jgi:hypothetical protein